jgi:tetratricopeptide (TPR) repeat protein
MHGPRAAGRAADAGGNTRLTDEDFGAQLRLFRRNSRDSLYGGALSQDRLADLLSEAAGVVYSRAAVSDWERGKGHIHKDARFVLVNLIRVLHESGGLASRAEADRWLAAGNYRALDNAEAARIAPAWTARPAADGETPSSNGPIFMPPMLPPHPILGRAELLGQLKEWLFDGRTLALSALNGLPGMGKSALALVASHDPEVRAHFSDGVLWAGLGTRPDIFALLGRWAEAVGVPPAEIARLGAVRLRAAAIHEAIRDRRFLVIIDDVWAYDHALPFKVGGPACAHLLTSRMPPIGAAFAGVHALTVRELPLAEGMALLRWLAPQVVEREPAATQVLVEATGGLPLALVLLGNELRLRAAAGSSRRIREALEDLRRAERRLQLQSPQSPIDREQHPSLPNDAPVSLYAVIGVSDALLPPQAQAALRALAAFPPKPNDFSEAAALAVSGAGTETLDLLVDSGLLETCGGDRYALHQAICDYARAEAGDEAARARLVAYAHDFVVAGDPSEAEIERELENINAALFAAEEGGLAGPLWEMLDALFPYYDDKGHYEPALSILKRLDARTDRPDPAVKLYLGRIAIRQGDSKGAEAEWLAGLAAARAAGDHAVAIKLLSNLSMQASQSGDYDRAEAYLDEASEQAAASGDWEEVTRALGNRGRLAYIREDYVEADVILREARSVATDHGFDSLASGIDNLLGIVAKARGRYADALEYFEAGLALARRHRFAARTSTLLVNVGSLLNEMEHYEEATAYLEEGLGLVRQLGDRAQESHLLMNLAIALAGLGKEDGVEGYFAAAHSLAASLDNHWLLALIAVEWGTVRLKSGNPVGARPLLETAVADSATLSPNAAILGQGYFGLAQLALLDGDREAADRLSRVALEASSADAGLLAAKIRAWREGQAFGAPTEA